MSYPGSSPAWHMCIWCSGCFLCLGSGARLTSFASSGSSNCYPRLELECGRALARSCTSLTELRARGLSKLTHVGLRSISLRCRGLRVLDIAGASCIDDMCLRVLAAGLWALEDVSLSALNVRVRLWDGSPRA